jgi:thiosulfate reductase cytochrome b subunit
MDRRETGRRPAHSVAIRVMHWIGVYAMGCMIFSGWEIYNASPSLPFLFPAWTGLGGWLGGALAWHLSAMWLLFADGIAYLVYGFASGHFRRDLKPPRPADVGRDLSAALRFRLKHHVGHYNAVQRALYAVVIIAVILQVMTGLAIWKPVQLGWLAGLFGGYPMRADSERQFDPWRVPRIDMPRRYRQMRLRRSQTLANPGRKDQDGSMPRQAECGLEWRRHERGAVP